MGGGGSLHYIRGPRFRAAAWIQPASRRSTVRQGVRLRRILCSSWMTWKQHSPSLGHGDPLLRGFEAAVRLNAHVWMEPASKVPPHVNKMSTTTPLGFSAIIITATPGSDAKKTPCVNTPSSGFSYSMKRSGLADWPPDKWWSCWSVCRDLRTLWQTSAHVWPLQTVTLWAPSSTNADELPNSLNPPRRRLATTPPGP